MISTSRIHTLLEKVSAQQATPEECEELLQVLESTGQNEAIDQMDVYYAADHSAMLSLSETEKEYWKPAVRQIIEVKYPGKEADGHRLPVYTIFRRYRWFLAAASVLFVFLLGIGIYEKISSEKSDLPPSSGNGAAMADIQPGGERATLTLADGKKIVLDETRNGNIAQQGHIRVVKLTNGQLAYEAGNGASEKIAFNTLTVPRGGQYALTLSDGSRVWLNAASSIKYPTAFTDSERMVEISGEAYLEIAKNTRQPFKVMANGTEVVVLGTSLNINAYPDEASVKTTLIEGAVRITNTSTGGKVTLNPGEQAEVGAATNAVKVKAVDTEQILAWKNGLFSFDNADVTTIMRQLSRWYDINIVYEKGVPAQRFYGEMNRNLTLSQVLKGLEVSKVKFKIEGRDLIVLP